MKNIKIAWRIGGGFAVVLLLLSVLAATAILSLNTLGETFSGYRALASSNTAIGDAQTELLMARLSVKTYIQSGTIESIDAVKMHGEQAIALTDAAIATTDDMGVYPPQSDT